MDRVADDNILNLIPQRSPFVMISALIDSDGAICTTSFIISKDNVLCDGGYLNPSGLMENMAQTAAAMDGYAAKSKNNQAITGFIGDIRDFSYTELPPIGEEIVTGVILEMEVLDVAVISGKVFFNGKEIASCKMKIFRKSAK